MDDSDQNEIARLKREVERLQRLLDRRTPVPVQPNTTSLVDNSDFVTDLARFAEGLITEKAVRKKYGFDEATWSQLAEDEKLVEKIEATKTARIRGGISARERAQELFATAPTTLGTILNNEGMPARSRIEASKEIRQIAVGGPDTTPAAERFSIVINLGADEVIRFNKPITPGVDDDGNIIDSTLLPMIAAKNREGNDGGEPI